MLREELRPGELLLGDRGFCTWGRLDRDAYPAHALAALYRRRSERELALRHLQVTLQMDRSRGHAPATLEREIRRHLLRHNRVRRGMLEAARRHRVPVNRLGFAGALTASRRCGEALLQSRSQRQRKEPLDELFCSVAADRLPDRPGRREPRAVKRRPQPCPFLNRHRRHFKEIQHPNRDYQNRPFGKRYRNPRGLN